MEATANVAVNGQTYIVRMFNPLEAFEYLHRLVLVRGTGQSVTSLGRQALGQCNTPDGRSLADQGVFQEWFSKHPADMLELEVKAMDALTAPWERPAREAETPSVSGK